MSAQTGRPRLSLVVAAARNGVIGSGGGMPWRLPTDLKRFRALTLGHPIVMGRLTFRSIGRPLDGRTNIVVSRDPGFRPEGVLVAPGLEEALALAAAAPGGDEVMVVGGGTLYAALLPRADRIYRTLVEAEPVGDTTFPPLDPATWTLVEETAPPRAERDSAAVRFQVFDRRSQACPTG